MGGNKTEYDFSDYKTFKKLFRDPYYKKITINDTEREQDEFNAVIGVLSDYIPQGDKYIEANFYEGREKNIKGFKDEIFPFDYDEVFEEQVKYKEEEKNIRDKNGLIDYRRLNRLFDAKIRDINDELVRKHFLVQDLGYQSEKM